MHRSKSLFRLIAEPLALAVVLALAARAVVRIYAIPSVSMVPTLRAGDHIAVTPYLAGAQPKRGDVIVFRDPLGRNELLVKRVVGIPGDLIESRAGRIIVSGHALAEPYLLEPAASGAIATQIVPAGCYFVMGDNRALSLDSRSWGPLPGKLVVGRARLVLWTSRRRPAVPAYASASGISSARPDSGSFRLLVPVQ
jgi:signal peptidase I